MKSGSNTLGLWLAGATLMAAAVGPIIIPAQVLARSHVPDQYQRGALIRLAQEGDDSDETEVPAADVEKYVAVYKAMHRDRALNVEQAAARQGMTLTEFRQLENRIQRDDAALQHVRDELQASAAQPSPAASPGDKTPAQ